MKEGIIQLSKQHFWKLQMLQSIRLQYKIHNTPTLLLSYFLELQITLLNLYGSWAKVLQFCGPGQPSTKAHQWKDSNFLLATQRAEDAQCVLFLPQWLAGIVGTLLALSAPCTQEAFELVSGVHACHCWGILILQWWANHEKWDVVGEMRDPRVPWFGADASEGEFCSLWNKI